ncbi:MAG: cyclic nucleotide-binding domain-containing protein [Calditrichaeota bacterium]|nr:cyclic nucleotide-binding domain-containing protein [Calditrichota bacterium]
MITTVEKVIFLQEVDIFELLTTEDLSHIAAICDEITVSQDAVLYKEGAYPDSMYLVLSGQIRLHQSGTEVMIAGRNDAFGTWALFDDQPRVVTAEALEESRMLRIDKEDFIDVLSENVRVMQGILKALVQRMHSLVSRVSQSQD